MPFHHQFISNALEEEISFFPQEAISGDDEGREVPALTETSIKIFLALCFLMVCEKLLRVLRDLIGLVDVGYANINNAVFTAFP